MVRSLTETISTMSLLLVVMSASVASQSPPYDVFPDAKPPYYRVRYEASSEPGGLQYAVNYTVWIPEGVSELRGVIVHQHGCGEGSCKSGLTGAFDLHWQALARVHDCALLAPSYEQPQEADCQMWCDPRNGSGDAFQRCLVDLGDQSGHEELASVPWALWGHSGGGHWAGGMVMLYPDRVAAAWLRSGVPLLLPNPKRPTIKVHELPDEALRVPMMCNLGTKEGVTEKTGRFAGVWPANQVFFDTVRGRGGLVGVAVDPLTSHECGNQRYLAIPWLDACLEKRLPKGVGEPLRNMPEKTAWLVPVPDHPFVDDPIRGRQPCQASSYTGDALTAAWLPGRAVAESWTQYVKDTSIVDRTPPPAPTGLSVDGSQPGRNVLSWQVQADLESGLAGFVIERDGQVLATLPEASKNPYGRPLFQNLLYSDTPTQPLVPMQYVDTLEQPNKKHRYRVFALNTAGLSSQASAEVTAESVR